ncbi:MAG: hypothetical protein QOJ62_1619 [Actinomycetota bacterium]|nr:hypothetical protein [Actinomycetota bacterium]
MSVAEPSAPAEGGTAGEELVDRGSGAIAARAGRGVVLTLGSQWLKLVLQVGSTIIIARLLSPHDYGVVGMVVALTGFADQLRDLGLSDASVQWDRLTRAQLDALFWLNTALGVAFAVLFCAGAPLVAAFFHRPELTVITLVLSSNFVASGLSAQHAALLRRRLRFGRLALADVGSMAASIVVGVTAAAAGAGYWALVAMYLVQAWARLPIVWFRADWWPGRPRRADGLGKLISFGMHLSGFNVVNYVTRNLDNVLIGRYRGPIELGLYTRAYSLLMLPLRQLNSPIMRVAVPTLAGLRDQPDRFRSYYRSALVGLAVVGMPAVVVLAVLSREVVVVLLGKQYAGAAPIFQMLAIAGIAQVVANTTGWLFIASARTRQMMWWGLASGPVIVVAFLIGLPGGAFGVARAYAVATLVLTVPGFWFATRRTPVSMLDVASAVWRPAVISGVLLAATAAAHRLSSEQGDGARLVIVGAVGVAVWVVGVWSWPTLRRDVSVLLSATGRGLTRRSKASDAPEP